MAVESRRRDQLNISLGNDSPLARKLHEAEQITGQTRSQIARSVLDAFLDTWLEVEQTRRRIVDAAKAASRAEALTVVAVRDLGTLRPPHRGDEYRPAPDYWKAVESRQPMPVRITSRHTNVPVRRTLEQRRPARSLEPAQASLDAEGDSVD
jgi:hypothetical protein